jgi:hypothetical protein
MTTSSRFPCDLLGWSLLGRTPGVCPSVITLEDQRVHHGYTLGMDDDWIEIDRIDVIGMIGGKLGQQDHQVSERFRVRRRQAAKRAENPRAFEAVEQRVCGNDIERYRG